MHAPPTEPFPRELEDRFEPGRALGRGGFGTVFFARDRRHDRPVAIKVRHDPDPAPRELARFRQEARLLASIRHPHLLGVFDAGTLADGRPYQVTEFAPGGDLATRLGTRPAPDLETRERWAGELCEAVAALHEAGLVHRDLKPENLLLGADDGLRLADLGLARRLDAPIRLTATGFVVGTPTFRAPEVITGGAAGKAADVWSAGAVLYALLYLRLWDPDDPAPPRRRLGASPAFDPVLLRCLALDPDARYPDGEALRRAWVGAGAGDSAGDAAVPGAETVPPRSPTRAPGAPPGGDAGGAPRAVGWRRLAAAVVSLSALLAFAAHRRGDVVGPRRLARASGGPPAPDGAPADAADLALRRAWEALPEDPQVDDPTDPGFRRAAAAVTDPALPLKLNRLLRTLPRPPGSPPPPPDRDGAAALGRFLALSARVRHGLKGLLLRGTGEGAAEGREITAALDRRVHELEEYARHWLSRPHPGASPRLTAAVAVAARDLPRLYRSLSTLADRVTAAPPATGYRRWLEFGEVLENVRRRQVYRRADAARLATATFAWLGGPGRAHPPRTRLRALGVALGILAENRLSERFTADLGRELEAVADTLRAAPVDPETRDERGRVFGRLRGRDPLGQPVFESPALRRVRRRLAEAGWGPGGS